jgi:hypothetical protein
VTHELDDNLHGRFEDLRDASLISLARAANQLRTIVGNDVLHLDIYEQDIADYWPLQSPVTSVGFRFLGDRLSVTVSFLGADPRPGLKLQSVVTPLLRRHGARVNRVSFTDDFGRPRVSIEFEYGSLRGLRVRDAYAVGLEVEALASSVNACGELDVAAIVDLVVAGQAELLVGQRENRYFDAKRSVYQPGTKEGAFELSKDVAAFANATAGGVLVCGLRDRRDQRDVVAEAKPIALESVKPRSWLRKVRNGIVPAPQGVAVLLVYPNAATGYVLVVIPPQPERLKPFLVKGARLGNGRLLESQITVVERVGEDTHYVDASQLHGLLAAGRAALALSDPAPQQDSSPF